MKTKTKLIIASILFVIGIATAIFAQSLLSISDVTVTVTQREKDALTDKGIENITIDKLMCKGSFCTIYLAKNGNMFLPVPLKLAKDFTLYKTGELEPLITSAVEAKLKAIANYNPNTTRISGGKVNINTGVTP